MKLKTVNYNYSKISKKYSMEQKKFKEDINVTNNIYLFFKDNECLYIGETGTTLKDRCYRHTEKLSEKDFFKNANIIYIIELDDCIGKEEREKIKTTFKSVYKIK